MCVKSKNLKVFGNTSIHQIISALSNILIIYFQKQIYITLRKTSITHFPLLSIKKVFINYNYDIFIEMLSMFLTRCCVRLQIIFPLGTLWVLHKFENYTGNEYQFTNPLLNGPDVVCSGNVNAIQLYNSIMHRNTLYPKFQIVI